MVVPAMDRVSFWPGLLNVGQTSPLPVIEQEKKPKPNDHTIVEVVYGVTIFGLAVIEIGIGVGPRIGPPLFMLTSAV